MYMMYIIFMLAIARSPRRPEGYCNKNDVQKKWARDVVIQRPVTTGPRRSRRVRANELMGR
jgi:hypothetical protein